LPFPVGTVTFSAEVAHGDGPDAVVAAGDGVIETGVPPGLTDGWVVAVAEAPGEAAVPLELPQAATSAAEQARTAATASPRAAAVTDELIKVPSTGGAGL
jgi:hypothetical protein